MATIDLSDGTKVEAKHIRMEYPDGLRIMASDEDFDIDQDGPSVLIRIGQRIFMDMVSSGKAFEQALPAVIISADSQELARVAIDLCLQVRGGDYPMQLEGQIIDW